MKSTTTYFVMLLLATLNLKSQEQLAKSYGMCVSTELTEKFIKENPQQAIRIMQENNAADEAYKIYMQNSCNLKIAATVYTIPVVFHVLQNGSSTPPTDAQINTALIKLNQEFNKQNTAELAGVNSLFTSVIGQGDIQFVFAKQDPNGKCTNGIIRHTVTNTVFDFDNATSTSLYPYSGSGAGKWATNRYLNFYIVSCIDGNVGGTNYNCPTPSGSAYIGGFAPLPSTYGSNDARDVAVFTYNDVSSNEKIIAHEIGHWLGLLHTFGGTYNSCGDDNITDTPPCMYSLNPGSCPPSNVNSCAGSGNKNNVQNIMNYANCKVMFTAGQVAKMRNTIQTVTKRNNLITSGNHLVTLTQPSGAPIVSVASNTSICSGTTVKLTASGAGTGASYLWSTGATTSTINVSPTSTKVYTVTGTKASNNCSDVATVTVTVKANPTVVATSQTICNGSSTTIVASGASSYTWNTGVTTKSLTTSPSITTVYTVTGTSANGCTDKATGKITVKSSATISVPSQTICSGSSAILSASGASTYTWNTGVTGPFISVSNTTNASYTVTGTSANGCKDMATALITIKSNPTVTATSQTICNGSSATLSANGASTYSWNTGAATANMTASPTVNTTYWVVGTAANGCKKTATTIIEVNPKPTVIVASHTICSGSSAVLSASGASTYTWNTGATTANLTVNPSTTTSYTVTGKNTSGCSNKATAKVTVVSNPTTPIVTANGMNLSSSSATGNQWFFNGNAIVSATSQTYNATQLGNYYVETSNSNGCSASSNTITITVTGINSISQNSQITIYPNPANDYLIVNTNDLVDGLTYSIYATNGQLVATGSLKNNESNRIELANLASGLYQVQFLISDTKQQVIRFIKN